MNLSAYREKKYAGVRRIDIRYSNLFVIRGLGRLLYGANNNKEVISMKKKADKANVTINVTILSNITLDGKSLICIIIAIICLTLVISICDPTTRAEIIRSLLSIVRDC